MKKKSKEKNQKKHFFEKNDLFKIVLIAILATVVLSWIIPYGNFSGSEFIKIGYGRQGIADIVASGVYGANSFLQQLLLLIFIGVFYGILSKTSGYQAFVQKIADLFKGAEKVFVIGISLIFALLTSFLSQVYVLFIFIPLIVSVANKLKLDKLTTFLCTFGSILVGILGATYGTEGLVYFVNYLNYYEKVELTNQILVRVGILALAFIVFTVFTVLHMNKVKAKKEKEEEIVEDLFEEKSDEKGKAKAWPMATFFVLIFVFTVLGFVNWNANFNISIFDKFHTWLTELSIGKFTIISYILGNNAAAFGTWDLFMVTIMMAVILVLSVIIYKVNLDTILDGAIEGIKKMVKPTLLLLLIFTVFVFTYWSPFTITISNWLFQLTNGNFNPFTTTISAAISPIFHIDFGYTGYALGEAITTGFGAQSSLAFVIYVAMNGLMQFVVPTGAVMLIGLSYLDIPYKKWIKHIWKFALIMLALLMVIFLLLTYI